MPPKTADGRTIVCHNFVRSAGVLPGYSDLLIRRIMRGVSDLVGNFVPRCSS